MTVLYNAVPQLRDKVCQFHNWERPGEQHSNKTLASCALWSRPYHKNLLSPRPPMTTNYSFQMWRLLAMSDVKASSLNVYDINTIRHVVPEDAQFNAQLRHSYLCTHLYFSKFCRSSVIPSTFPIFPSPNSCYPHTGSGTITIHVLRHLFNLQFLCQLKLPMQPKVTTFTLPPVLTT